jgi:hypothetical protein
MKEILLKNRSFATKVDDDDYEILNRYKWIYDSGYVKMACSGQIKMHRFIMGLEHGDKKEVDHMDHDGLNNQKSNLRICTTQQNQWNHRQRRGKSGFIGVSNSQSGRPKAHIQVDGKLIYLGRFDSLELAAKARDEAAIKYHGEFAVLNFPLTTTGAAAPGLL